MSRGGNAINIAYILGTVETKHVAKMQRMLYRLSRGTAFITTQELASQDMKSVSLGNQRLAKSILLIVFPSGKDKVFGNKLMTVCRIFDMLFYDYMSRIDGESKARMHELSEKVKDIVKVGYLA